MDMATEVHRSVIEVLIAQAAGQCATFADLLASLPGTPTVLKAAVARPDGRRWTLLEANPAVSTALNKTAPRAVLRCDLARDILPRLQAQVVAADPPWYPAHTRVFLWATSAGQHARCHRAARPAGLGHPSWHPGRTG
jgi:hypothetical protein